MSGLVGRKIVEPIFELEIQARRDRLPCLEREVESADEAIVAEDQRHERELASLRRIAIEARGKLQTVQAKMAKLEANLAALRELWAEVED